MTPSVTPARAASAISASVRAVVTSIGFSTRTCSPLSGRRDPLVGVQPRRAADRHHVQRPVRQETFERVVGDGAVPRGETLRVLERRRVDRRHADARNRGGRARVRVADVAGADEADVDH